MTEREYDGLEKGTIISDSYGDFYICERHCEDGWILKCIYAPYSEYRYYWKHMLSLFKIWSAEE